MTTKAKDKGQTDKSTKRLAVTVKAPKMSTAVFEIVGTAPLVINAFGKKAQEMIRGSQVEGSKTKKGKKKEPKDFDGLYEAAKHQALEGWCGIPATAFRNAMIRACSLAGFQMTLAKMAVFVEADGYDADDPSYPLVRITKGEPQHVEHLVRVGVNQSDIRPRPMWAPGWEATVRIRYDVDIMSATDIGNLLLRAGLQVGIGEGRPFSKMSCGMGWGLFDLKSA